MWKNVHPVSSAGIQTPPLTTRPVLPPLKIYFVEYIDLYDLH